MLSRLFSVSDFRTPAGGLPNLPVSLNLIPKAGNSFLRDQPVVGAPSRIQALPEGHDSSKLPAPVRCWRLCLFRLFYEVTDLGMLPELRQPPSKPSRPHII